MTEAVICTAIVVLSGLLAWKEWIQSRAFKRTQDQLLVMALDSGRAQIAIQPEMGPAAEAKPESSSRVEVTSLDGDPNDPYAGLTMDEIEKAASYASIIRGEAQ